jgi:membrane fusion protein (multidrug efflux system)
MFRKWTRGLSPLAEKRKNQVQVMSSGRMESDEKTTKTNGRGLARKMVKLVIALAAVGALVGIGLGVSGNKKETLPTEAAPVMVSVITVATEPAFPDTVELPGVVEPNKVVEVSAEADGRVEWIGPKKGAIVHKGEPLARLNTDLLRAQFQMAQAQAKNAETEFERIQGLVAKGAAPSRDLDSATTQLAVTKAQLEEARVRLARAQIMVPMNGVLNDLPVEEGEYVTLMPRTTIAEIVDVSVVKVAVEIPERDIPFLSVGDKADVRATTRGRATEQTGTITFISQVANERTRSTRIEITLANEQGLLRSGQIVHVRLTRQVLKDVILVPLLAVIPMEDGKAVYVVEPATDADSADPNQNKSPLGIPGRAERRAVELGAIKGDRVLIRSGLKPGDRLIVAGHRFVAPGQKVQIVPQDRAQP